MLKQMSRLNRFFTGGAGTIPTEHHSTEQHTESTGLEKGVKIYTGTEEIINCVPTSSKFDLPMIRILEDGTYTNKNLTLTICSGKNRPVSLLLPGGEVEVNGKYLDFIKMINVMCESAFLGEKIKCDRIELKAKQFQVKFHPFYGFLYRVNLV